MKPELLMKIVLRAWMGPNPPPVSKICEATSLQLYHEQADVQAAALRNRLTADSAAVAARYAECQRNRAYTTDTQRWAAVLLDAESPFLPVFRYTLIKTAGLIPSSTLLEEARREYRAWREEYDEVWGEKVPSELKEGGNHG